MTQNQFPRREIRGISFLRNRSRARVIEVTRQKFPEFPVEGTIRITDSFIELDNFWRGRIIQWTHRFGEPDIVWVPEGTEHELLSEQGRWFVYDRQWYLPWTATLSDLEYIRSDKSWKWVETGKDPISGETFSILRKVSHEEFFRVLGDTSPALEWETLVPSLEDFIFEEAPGVDSLELQELTFRLSNLERRLEEWESLLKKSLVRARQYEYQEDSIRMLEGQVRALCEALGVPTNVLDGGE